MVPSLPAVPAVQSYSPMLLIVIAFPLKLVYLQQNSLPSFVLYVLSPIALLLLIQFSQIHSLPLHFYHLSLPLILSSVILKTGCSDFLPIY